MKKSERTAITTSKIMEAAMNEFGKNGYSRGTMNNICNTGINKGLIYHNFKGKDELYLKCLEYSCQKLIDFLSEPDKTKNLESYMSARMDYFNQNPNEAHILFEAMLSPPQHLSEEINQIISELNALNEKMYHIILDSLILRDGISREDAVSYFHLMQLMLNGYFSSHSFQYMNMTEKVKTHEMIVSKLLDYMLYGIAKGEK